MREAVIGLSCYYPLMLFSKTLLQSNSCFSFEKKETVRNFKVSRCHRIQLGESTTTNRPPQEVQGI